MRNSLGTFKQDEMHRDGNGPACIVIKDDFFDLVAFQALFCCDGVVGLSEKGQIVHGVAEKGAWECAEIGNVDDRRGK